MIDETGPPRFTHCRCCGQVFSEFIVYSEAGWLETQITGLCEVCYDILNEIPRREDGDDGSHEEN